MARARTRRRAATSSLLPRILEHDVGAADDVSERILAAATEQAEDFGLRRFTMDDVARRVRLSRVTLYRYFPGKDALLEAIMLRELRKLLDDIDEVVSPCETLEQRLIEGFVFGMVTLREHRLLARLLRTEPELLLPNLTVKGGPILTAGREFIARFARKDADAGGLKLSDEEIDAVSELLGRMVLSFVLTPDSVIGLRTEAEIRSFAEHYLAPTLQALTSPRD
jgi:AcrR family transcriptional regulator